MSEWAAYGFPNPFFRPCRLPMEGLCKALAERWLPFELRSNMGFLASSSGWCIDDIMAYSFAPFMTGIRMIHRSNRLPREKELTTVNVLHGIDDEIKRICGNYVNHTVKDFTAWTWEELCAVAAPDGLAEFRYFCPVLSTKWAVQRYRMINLLKYPLVVKLRFSVFNSSTHNGIPSNMTESVAYAITIGEPGEATGDIINTVHGIYGPDHGWREGSYCCNIRQSANIRIPETLVSCASNFYVVLDVTSPNGDDTEFYGMGFDSIHLGRCIIPFSSDGTALTIGFPYAPRIPVAPVKGRETHIGWKAKCMSFGNVSPLFRFYDDMGETDLWKTLL